ncbi:MAG: hypothetical protein E6J47_00760 [Chloroflexi bacterium]|nr:MAG: hypothetical protein E6J47_00760 [Chloroflexota bacterium]
MNWRALGCGTLAAAAFVGLGLLAMSMAFTRFEGCPTRLQWGDRTYDPAASPAASPSFAGGGKPVEIGSTLIGLTTRQVWGPPGSDAPASANVRPDRIILDCADGTFQEYRGAAGQPSALPPFSRSWVASANRSVMPAT